MRLPSALLLILCAPAVQARPATFVTVHAVGLAALPPAVFPPVRPLGVPAVATDPRARFLPLITREAAVAGLPAAVADAVARIESGYDPAVVGSVGEIGLMQVRPATAAMLGFRGTTADLASPEVNVHYGVRYLAEAWRRADGDLCRALMKYRAGHGAETMSPLSQAYCARAQAILGDPRAGPAPVHRLWAQAATRRPVQAPSEPDATASAPPQSFWAAHRARVARLNATVEARWRARGWKPDRTPG